jgi:hypothetical protein
MGKTDHRQKKRNTPDLKRIPTRRHAMKSNINRRLMEVSAKQLKCNHALTGAAPANKMCPYCYQCATCPYDQMLEDTVHIYRGLTPVPALA